MEGNGYFHRRKCVRKRIIADTYNETHQMQLYSFEVIYFTAVFIKPSLQQISLINNIDNVPLLITKLHPGPTTHSRIRYNRNRPYRTMNHRLNDRQGNRIVIVSTMASHQNHQHRSTA